VCRPKKGSNLDAATVVDALGVGIPLAVDVDLPADGEVIVGVVRGIAVVVEIAVAAFAGYAAVRSCSRLSGWSCSMQL
jgi:hypothetical protein